MACVQEMMTKFDRCISTRSAMCAISVKEVDNEEVRKCLSAPSAVAKSLRFRMQSLRVPAAAAAVKSSRSRLQNLRLPAAAAAVKVPEPPVLQCVVVADFKVVNTFLHVDDCVDAEIASLQASRRRDCYSCPLPSPSTEAAPEESLCSPACTSRQEHFVPEPAVESALEQTGSKAFVSQVEESMPGREAGPDHKEAWEQVKTKAFKDLMALVIAKHHSCDRHAVAAVVKAISARTSCPNPPNPSNSNRLWCHLYMNQCVLEPGFDFVKKVIGRVGWNTRAIFESTGIEILVRGQGSGHIEPGLGREAPVPLMVSLANESGCAEAFSRAFELTKELLQETVRRFHVFCRKHGLPLPTTPLFFLGDISLRALTILCPADFDGIQVCLQSPTGCEGYRSSKNSSFV